MMIIFYLLLSVTSALAITAKDMSTYGGTDQFYNNGKYEDLSYGYVNGWTSYKVDSAQKSTFTRDASMRTFQVSAGAWKYLSLENLSDTKLEGVIRTYYNEDLVSSQWVCFSQGKNQIELSSKKINRVLIGFFQEEGQNLQIRQIFVSNYPDDFDLSGFEVRAMVLTGVIFAVIIFLDMLLQLRSRILQMLKALGNSYVRLLNKTAEYIPEVRMSNRVSHMVRVGIFLILLLWNMYCFNYGKKVSLYQTGLQIYVLACILIYIVSKPHIQKRAFKANSSMGLWVLLSIAMCISDFFVNKTYCYMGYVFLLSYGILFLVYCDKQLCKEIFYDMALAIQIFFVLVVSISLLRGDIYGVEINRMAIGFKNANACANYMTLTIISCIALLEDACQRTRRRWFIQTLIMSAEAAIAFYIIRLTRSRWALAVALLFASIWAFRIIKRKTRDGNVGRKVFAVGIIILFSVLVSGFGWKVVFHQMDPQMQERYSQYVPEAMNVMEVQASQVSRLLTGIKSGDMDFFTSGRTGIWITYIRGMNLWGHKYLCNYAGKKFSSHNMFIAYFYRYGLLTGILFTCFWISSVCKSVRRLILEKCSWFGLLQFGIITGYCLLAQLDAFEHPWLYAGWTFAYMGIGILIVNEDVEK